MREKYTEIPEDSGPSAEAFAIILARLGQDLSIKNAALLTGMSYRSCSPGIPMNVIQGVGGNNILLWPENLTAQAAHEYLVLWLKNKGENPAFLGGLRVFVSNLACGVLPIRPTHKTKPSE